MASISSIFGFDQLDLNLYRVFINTQAVNYIDNANISVSGVVYEDLYEAVWSYGGDYFSSTFAGSSITIDGSFNVTGGTVTGYVESYWNGAQYVPYAGITGIGISAVALYQAGLTPSTSDEYALINAALAGADTFDMSNEADRIFGLGGNDTMRGNGGADLINGGGDSDRLYGGGGKDTLVGGSGADRFIFTRATETGALAGSADVIRDFTKGSDKIDLSGIDAFSPTGGTNDSFIFRGTGAFSSASAGELRYEKFDLAGTADDYTMVWIDTDGDAGAEVAIKLAGLVTLAGGDFIL